MLKLEFCRERQARLLRQMERAKVELAILGNPKTIYYFTGALLDPTQAQAFAIAASGHSLLVTNSEPRECVAHRIETYTAYSLDRLFSRASVNAEVAAAVSRFAAHVPGPAAVEFESVSSGVLDALQGRAVVNLTPDLMEMRRRKDPDEIEAMRATTELTEAGYAAIKARLEPGMTENEAHVIMYEAMVRHAGTSVDLRGDFACGTRAITGGAPTDRKVQSGDLYILDIFPMFEGYMCDLCRTFAAGPPTQLQQDAWAHIMEAHELAQRLIRPGASCRAIYEEIRTQLDRFEPAKGSFYHHAGHGLGMDAWEFPWLIPGSDQVIQEGDVIACEPGLYSEALAGGIRLEHNYLVGKDSVTTLDTFPMDLR